MTVDALIARWLGKQGEAERANYQMFLTELTQALGLPAPDPKGAGLSDPPLRRREGRVKNHCPTSPPRA